VNLQQLQAAFVGYVSGETTGGALLPLVREHGGASSVERLALHARVFRLRPAEVVSRAFPHTSALMGATALAAAALDHASRLASAPPPRPDLLGAWSDHLRAAAPCPDRPDLADLAALEHARRLVGDAEDVPAIGVEALASLAPERLATAALRFVPAIEIVHTRFDVASVWAALEARRDATPPEPTPADLLVWRGGSRVLHAVLSPTEAAALRAALGGAPLASVCAAFAGALAPDEAAYDALVGWFSDGLVANVVFPEDV
jgi:hypothetical protein